MNKEERKEYEIKRIKGLDKLYSEGLENGFTTEEYQATTAKMLEVLQQEQPTSAKTEQERAKPGK